METISAPICDECTRKEECQWMCENRIDQFIREEDAASASSSSFQLINQDKYVGIERSHWNPKPIMPLSGFAFTNSGKSSPKPVSPAVEVITLEHQEFSDKTLYPKSFPVPIMCVEFCDKLSVCKLVHTEFDDLCKHHSKLGKLVHPVDVKWSVRFNMEKDQELKANTTFAKSAVSGIIPEVALGHDKAEDKTFRAYNCFRYLDSLDNPEGTSELEYTMDTGMASPSKSQEGYVPSFLYRTVYRDRNILLGFKSKTVKMTYEAEEHKWVFYPPVGKFVLTSKKVVRTSSYHDDLPVYKWISLPTLRPIGCYLNRGKVIGSSTIVTRKERKFGSDKHEIERQARQHEKVHIAQDEIDARKQVVPATC